MFSTCFHGAKFKDNVFVAWRTQCLKLIVYSLSSYIYFIYLYLNILNLKYFYYLTIGPRYSTLDFTYDRFIYLQTNKTTVNHGLLLVYRIAWEYHSLFRNYICSPNFCNHNFCLILDIFYGPYYYLFNFTRECLDT